MIGEADKKPARRLPEESLRRARNILLNLNWEALPAEVRDLDRNLMATRTSQLCKELLETAQDIERLRPAKPEEGGEHGQD